MFQELFWTWVPWIFNQANMIISKSQSIYRVVYNEMMVKKEWLFVKNSEIPVSSEVFGNIDDENIKWRCTVNPGRFIAPFSDSSEKHLPYLGFTVRVSDQQIDLSDWVNEARWSGSEEPTIREIFLLWSCETGESYFHCLDQMQVDIVTDMGDTLRTPL
jgi:hypothetical protein